LELRTEIGSSGNAGEVAQYPRVNESWGDTRAKGPGAWTLKTITATLGLHAEVQRENRPDEEKLEHQWTKPKRSRLDRFQRFVLLPLSAASLTSSARLGKIRSFLRK
jgi:hypothetical protein